jgi:hypothetical protein
LAETGDDPVFLFLPAKDTYWQSGKDNAPKMVIRIAFVLGPERLAAAALRGERGPTVLHRRRVSVSSAARCRRGGAGLVEAAFVTNVNSAGRGEKAGRGGDRTLG